MIYSKLQLISPFISYQLNMASKFDGKSGIVISYHNFIDLSTHCHHQNSNSFTAKLQLKIQLTCPKMNSSSIHKKALQKYYLGSLFRTNSGPAIRNVVLVYNPGASCPSSTNSGPAIISAVCWFTVPSQINENLSHHSIAYHLPSAELLHLLTQRILSRRIHRNNPANRRWNHTNKSNLRFALEDFYDAESNSALAVEHFGKKIVVWPPRGLFGAWRSSVGWAV